MAGSGWTEDMQPPRWGLVYSLAVIPLHTECTARELQQQDGGDHLAAFRHQNIVGAAGGGSVHAFYADVRCDQMPVEAGMRELQLAARAQDQYFRVEIEELVKVALIERRKILH